MVQCIILDIWRKASNVGRIQCGGGAVRILPSPFFDLRYLARLRNVKKVVGQSTDRKTAERPSKSAFWAVKMRQPLT